MGLFLYNGITLKNEDSAQKVGTDSILLGNWLSPLPSDSRMLDIGTGTGILALMCAQKSASGAMITALEPDAPSAAEAAFNFASSPWAVQLRVLEITLQKYLEDGTEGAEKYDYIFTNPPYFKNSLKAPDGRRCTARHADSLTHEEIIAAAFSLLRPGGRLALILPTAEGEAFKHTAELYHIGRRIEGGFTLRLTRIEKVQTAPDKPVKRWMMEFTKSC